MKHTKLLSALIAAGLLLTGCARRMEADDLMESITAQSISADTPDDSFTDGQMAFSLSLFQKSIRTQPEQSVLISPLSVILALAMTANGAAGQTLAEMEQTLSGGTPIAALNNHLLGWISHLPQTDLARLISANSAWFRDDDRLTVREEFLQTAADYYSAQAYRAPFDSSTVRDINDWVSTHTDGMIDSILNEIPDAAVLYLVNALTFEAEWQTVYTKNDVRDGTFTAADGSQRKADMMHSREMTYLEDDSAAGFLKYFAGGDYAFAAMLPNEGVDIGDYVASLTAESLSETLANARQTTVWAAMPRFTQESSLDLNEILADMGMPSAFDADRADFSAMAQSDAGNIFISRVLHKTFIAVDELGTRAGAATVVEMADGASLETEEPKRVTLDRPFVYMILDCSTNLPLFMGTVMDI